MRYSARTHDIAVDRQAREAVRAWHLGLSVKVIAAQMKVSASAVSYWLKRKGIFA